MGKRSAFTRIEDDAYPTPFEAVLPLVPFLEVEVITRFVEPCAGDGQLVEHLTSLGYDCAFSGDQRSGWWNALGMTPQWFEDTCAEAIITNPPWTRDQLHPLILHLSLLAPTWLLLDADWPHTKQAAPYLKQCSHIVAIGRVKWIANSPHTGKDNACWYRFDARHQTGPRFYGREPA